MKVDYDQKGEIVMKKKHDWFMELVLWLMLFFVFYNVVAGTGTLLLNIEMLIGAIILYLPRLLARIFHFTIPSMLYFFYTLFILGSVYLGTGFHFYSIPYWDKGLHLISGALLGSFALSLYGALTDNETQNHPQRALICVYMLSFAMFAGVVWEFYEFTCDGIANLNLQRYLSAGHALVGRAALMDTMGDLIADFIGGMVLTVYTYLQIRRDPLWIKQFFFHKD